MQLTCIDGVKCVTEGVKCSDFFWKSCIMGASRLRGALSLTPCSSYITGLVPWSTPQTFSRMVVLPAFALPMIRIRK
jgi:hypothetical protein